MRCKRLHRVTILPDMPQLGEGRKGHAVSRRADERQEAVDILRQGACLGLKFAGGMLDFDGNEAGLLGPDTDFRHVVGDLPRA